MHSTESYFTATSDVDVSLSSSSATDATVDPFAMPMPLLSQPRIADDADFVAMKRLIDDDVGWTIELAKSETRVWTRNVTDCNFHMVKMAAEFPEIGADVVYDVLLDPDYRRDWDSHMVASEDIGCLNVNNDIGYYAMSCPAPLKSRDFVLMRSWLDTGPMGEQMLLSRSVEHRDWPPKKGFVRANSYITGFVIRPLATGGCWLGYVAHCDPQGALPPWLVNKVTHTLGPRMVKDLRKAALGYVQWKTAQTHKRKPWRNPEEILCPRITIEDCLVTQPASNGVAIPKSLSTHSSNQASGRRSLPATPCTERPKTPLDPLDSLATAAAAAAQRPSTGTSQTSSKNLLKFRKSLRLGRK